MTRRTQNLILYPRCIPTRLPVRPGVPGTLPRLFARKRQNGGCHAEPPPTPRRPSPNIASGWGGGQFQSSNVEWPRIDDVPSSSPSSHRRPITRTAPVRPDARNRVAPRHLHDTFTPPPHLLRALRLGGGASLPRRKRHDCNYPQAGSPPSCPDEAHRDRAVRHGIKQGRVRKECRDATVTAAPTGWTTRRCASPFPTAPTIHLQRRSTGATQKQI